MMLDKPTILALDPGGTTGLAIRMEDGSLLTATASTPEEVYDFIGNESLYDVVIIENFKAQTIDKWGLHTVRIVGGVYAICHMQSIKHVLHQPQDRRPFLTDARTLLRGRRVCVHEIDATAHLLAYEYKVSQQKDT